MSLSPRLHSAALVSAIVFGAAALPAQPFMSRSHGPTFGVSAAAVGLTGDNAAAESITGTGVHLELGWHARASHFGVLLDYVDVGLDDEGPPALRDYSHIGVNGRYLFRTDRAMARPYVQIGLLRREVTSRVGVTPLRTARSSSVGGTLGGGVQLFVARPVAIDLGAQLALGPFSDWKSNGQLVNVAPLKPASTVLRLGVRFWPGVR
jgi:opacity protein-like surface antigen